MFSSWGLQTMLHVMHYWLTHIPPNVFLMLIVLNGYLCPCYKQHKPFNSVLPVNDLGTVSLPFYSLLSAFVVKLSIAWWIMAPFSQVISSLFSGLGWQTKVTDQWSKTSVTSTAHCLLAGYFKNLTMFPIPQMHTDVRVEVTNANKTCINTSLPCRIASRQISWFCG